MNNEKRIRELAEKICPWRPDYEWCACNDCQEKIKAAKLRWDTRIGEICELISENESSEIKHLREQVNQAYRDGYARCAEVTEKLFNDAKKEAHALREELDRAKDYLEDYMRLLFDNDCPLAANQVKTFLNPEPKKGEKSLYIVYTEAKEAYRESIPRYERISLIGTLGMTGLDEICHAGALEAVASHTLATSPSVKMLVEALETIQGDALAIRVEWLREQGSEGAARAVEFIRKNADNALTQYEKDIKEKV